MNKPIAAPRPNDKTPETFPALHPAIDHYLSKLFELAHNPHASARQAMEELAKERDFPIVGPQVGRFLQVMAASIGAQRIFEFGSGFGYSALWFAPVVGSLGSVVCVDGEADNRRLAEQFLQPTGLWERLDFHTGWAQEVFKSAPGVFDVVYNDADKGDYPEIWQLAKSRIRRGGLYIADNTLWYGRVTLEVVQHDTRPGWTEAIREHNRQVVSDPDFDAFLHPVRDGLLVARRRR